MKLLNIDANAKTVKGQKQGYMTAILYLAPANVSGYEVCPMSTAGCRAACLYTAGRGAFSTVQQARIAKTKFFFEARATFMAQLVKEIDAFVKKARKLDLIPVVRLNGTSDIVWERIPVEGLAFTDGSVPTFANVMEAFPDVQFYDYTKRANRRNLPANYHLTFSLAEDNEVNANKALTAGMNVAVVFRTAAYPKTYLSAVVVDGDESDLRFLDGNGKVVGLYAKGKAKKDTSGFVKEVA